MRRFLGPALALILAGGSAQAAWVWVYEGRKRVVMPPEGGEPPWAQYPDANGDGKPDPVITHVDLRIENETGEKLARARTGQTIYLVATPELGGLELEKLVVRFHLIGPQGEAQVLPEKAIAGPGPLGTAPAVYRAEYTIPSAPVEEHVGEYTATIELQIGAVVLPVERAPAVALRVLGPRETTPEKIAREVKSGLRRAGDEISGFGQEVAAEVRAWLDRRREGPAPGALRIVHDREAQGMAETLPAPPTSPLSRYRDRLAFDRVAAVRSHTPPARSLIVIPLGELIETREEARVPVGYLALSGLRPSGVPATVAPGLPPDLAHVYALELEVGPEDGESLVHVVSAGGQSVAALPVSGRWLRQMPWPNESYLKVERQPTDEAEELVQVKIVSPVAGGAVRLSFTLPIVGTSGQG